MHVAKKAAGSRKFLTRESDRQDLLKRVTTELHNEIERFLRGGDRVIFVADSPSWRKQIQDAEHYKANRDEDRKKDDIDMGVLFELISNYQEFIESLGGTFSQVENAEGDDLILYWSKHLLEKGESSIIVSADKDLHALAKFQRNNFVAIWSKYSKYRKFVCAEGTMEYLNKEDEVSLFNMTPMGLNQQKKQLLTALASEDAEIVEVTPNRLNFNKILIGDSSDNIPSVVQKVKGTRTYKLTDRKSASMWEKYVAQTGYQPRVSQILEDENAQDTISRLALNELGVEPTEENLLEAKKNLKLNLKLVYLSDDVVPDWVSDGIKEHIDVQDALLHPFKMLSRKEILEKVGVKEEAKSFFDF